MNEMEPLDIAALSQSNFTSYLESEFTIGIEGSDDVVTLTLLEISEYPDHRPEDMRSGRAPFGLVFGCSTHKIPQSTYCLNHDTLAPLVIFLSPFELYEDGHKLEAIFS